MLTMRSGIYHVVIGLMGLMIAPQLWAAEDPTFVERPENDPLLLEQSRQREEPLKGVDPGPPPTDFDVPLPASAGGVAIEIVSVGLEDGGYEVHPRVSVAQRSILANGLLLGVDIAAAPQTGQTSWAQVSVGYGFHQGIPHPYGQGVNAETRYEESLASANKSSTWSPGSELAYEVVEGGVPTGWVVDVRSVGVMVSPRAVLQYVDPDESAFSVAGFAGLYGFYQRGPGWVMGEEYAGRLKPVTTYFGEVGAAYQRGQWWGEMSMSITGGPSVVGFSRRRLYGRIGGRFNANTSEVFLGIGTGHQRNPSMGALPLMMDDKR